MLQFVATVERLTQLSPALAEVRVACREGRSLPRPGQFLLARSPDPSRYLRQVLFPRAIDAHGFSFEVLLAPGESAPWLPGSPVDLLGPLGSPLPLEPSFRRFLLVDGGPGPGRLLPAAFAGVERGAEIALLLGSEDYPTHQLPAEIEIRQGDWTAELPDALAWADFILVDAGDPPAGQLRALLDRLRSARSFAARAPIHVLLSPPMPCGVGACGACAIAAHGGWRLACVDGPAFLAHELEAERTA